MNALDDIQTLLSAMRDRGAEMETFRKLMAAISQSLADAVTLLGQKPEAAEVAPEVRAVVEALQRLSIPAPAITVAAAPPVIHVMPSKVELLPARAVRQVVTGTFTFSDSGRPSGFTLVREPEELSN